MSNSFGAAGADKKCALASPTGPRRTVRSTSSLGAVFMLAVGIAAGFLLGGCDVFYGVTHTSQHFVPLPTDSCVVNAVASIPGMNHVESRLETGGRPLTLHGIEKPDQIHRFLYEYKGVHGNFYYKLQYDGRAEFRHTFLSLGTKPPQATIDSLYPAFRAADDVLESQCGLIDLKAAIHEKCLGVRCGGA
jgi:hypothetical protein